MHPNLVAALAAERHADLLRAAEAHRHVPTQAANPVPSPRGRLDGFSRLVAASRARLAAAVRPAPDLCCT